MNLTTDLDIYFADFGVSATITETAKAARVVKVLFDQTGYIEQGMITDKPQATVKETNLTGVDLKTTTITIDGTEYRMTRPIPDGAGLVSVGLTRN